jgi:hypothetical protein
MPFASIAPPAEYATIPYLVARFKIFLHRESRTAFGGVIKRVRRLACARLRSAAGRGRLAARYVPRIRQALAAYLDERSWKNRLKKGVRAVLVLLFSFSY